MTELRNVEAEIARFRTRVLVVGMVVLACFALLAARMVYLQVVRHDDLRAQAESNRTAIVPIVPNRGLILDRNGVVLASNYSAYTLEITPSKTLAGWEATADELDKVLDITARDRRRFKKLLDESKSFESLPIRTRLTDTEVAQFAAQRFRFPGVEIKARLFRNYPYGELASHVIGYIGRINQAEKAKIDEGDDPANYRGTEYMGKLGVEQSFEEQLHGITGVERVETSAGGRAMRKLASNPSTPGNVVVMSIDIKLQKLVEDMYGERRGALVAIDPRNGEVLAFVSKPTFDPNLFVDGIDSDSWAALNEDIDKPLLNRALRGTYPPGSTYKPLMAMAALNSGKRAANVVIQDNLTYSFGGRTFGSPEADRPGPKDMRLAIVGSSNVYFYSLANEMGVDLIHDQLAPFSLGRRTGIDLQGEVTGDLPSQEWKRKRFRKPEHQKWYAGETISLGIGQGYNNFTMLQMANAYATIASGGLRFKPRLVREIRDMVQHTTQHVSSDALEPLPLNPEHVNVIRNAMHGVTMEGTSARVFAGAGYTSGGKTGTAQAVGLKAGEKYSNLKVDEHKRDHSLYVAFAPVENPTIALALIVENAGWGPTSAAPIARRVFDYWLLGQYPNEQDLAAVTRGQAGAPIGKPLLAADVPWPRPAVAAPAPAPSTSEPSAVALVTGAASPSVQGGASAPASPNAAPVVIPPDTPARERR